MSPPILIPTHSNRRFFFFADKFGLAEFLTNAACASLMNTLEALGLTEKQLKKLISWAESRTVSLRLSGEERCVFDREETRKVESSTEYVTERSSSIFGTSKRTDKVVTKITEFVWKFDNNWELSAYKGNDPEDKIVLQTGKGHFEIVTSVKTSPKPEVHIVPVQTCAITWLLSQIEASTLAFKFAINRSVKSCHTPRQNSDIGLALAHFSTFASFAGSVANYFQNNLFPTHTGHALNLSSINSSSLFVPIVPLFESKAKSKKTSSKAPAGLVALPADDAPELQGAGSSSSSAVAPASNTVSSVLPVGDSNAFLWEQKRSFSEKFAELAKTFPAKDAKDARIITAAEAIVVTLCKHAEEISQRYTEGVDYIEHMLYTQLVSAIGKVVTPIDFTNYMRFHNRKLFRSAYEPKPFCHAVRRPEHFPEGTISIEANQNDGTMAEPIMTNVRVLTQTTGGVPMRFPINAATNIVFGGNRYLHAWVSHQFAGHNGQSLNLIARARQFSSFILVVGRIASAEVFDPKAAMIIKDKDDLNIPLMLETIPAAKEFKERINSMSPEQQRFCKAYRSMQLESTMFGLVVIQIKPQIEKLLNLVDDSLTKEIRLTQDLMELFIKYQVPSDLLSFDIRQRPQASASERVNFVKECVKKMQAMLDDKKKDELKQKTAEAVYKVLDSDSASSDDEYDDDEDDGEAEEQEEEMIIKPKYRSRGLMMKKDSAPVKEKEMEKQKESAPKRKMARRSSGGAAPPAPKPAPPSSTPTAEAPKPVDVQQQAELMSEAGESAESEIEAVDFTKIPAELDAKCEELDEDGALRPTIINIGPTWTKKQTVSLMSDPTTTIMTALEQQQERSRTFDLLDALSRSGSLPIDQAELHIVVAATHCFDKSIIATIIKDNVNPIEKVERSALLVASTLQDQATEDLIKHDQLDRVKMFSPMLFPAEAAGSIAQ
jgi:hypothetical protein